MIIRWLICKKNGNSAGCDNEITFLPNVGGYKWATSGVVPEVDEFYHVVGVWDKAAGKARIYVNGELKNEVAASGNLTLSGNNIYHWFAIGADPSAANGANTSGTWDVVSCKIYDDALTTDQVSMIYADLINRTGRNSLIEYVNKVKDSVDTDTYASQFNAVDDYKTILEQCQAAIAANTATGAEYNALEQQLRAAYAQVQMPVADVLDVKFHDDGRATDESTMGNTIHQKGDITVEDASNKDGNVYYNKELGRYVYQTDNTWGAATPPAGYYVIDYAPSRSCARASCRCHWAKSQPRKARMRQAMPTKKPRRRRPDVLPSKKSRAQATARARNTRHSAAQMLDGSR